MLSGLDALSLVPIPSSAILVAFGLFSKTSLRYLVNCGSPSISTTLPFLTVRVTGGESCLVVDQFNTIIPSDVPSTGAAYTSPAGRFQKAPADVIIPVSAC